MALLLTACATPEEAPVPPPTAAAPALFIDATAEAGLDFVHHNGMFGGYHMAVLMGPGAALFDAHGDGDLDAYLVQGTDLAPGSTPSRSDRLFRNDTVPEGPPRFTDVTSVSGELGTGYGMGVAAADYDADGDVDLYVTNFGPNQLLRNRGDGTFEDVTAAAGAGDERWSVPAVFFDFDGDGRLDLYVGNYLVYEHATDGRVCVNPSGGDEYCGASLFPGDADRLLRNLGDGTFEDVTEAAGLVVAEPGRALGAVAADLDADGDVDLYVGNDAGANQLWRNLGGPAGRVTFVDDALLSGTALNGAGKTEATMGIGVADYDRDGDADLFLAHLVVETHTLYRNRGDGLFEDATAAAGLAGPSRLHTGFGTAFLDFDGDGWLDLFVANGAVQSIASLVTRGDPFPFHETNQLLRNLGADDSGAVRYQDVSDEAGDVFTLSASSRGTAVGDIDGDGDTDLLVANNAGSVRLLRNPADPGDHWVGLRPVTGGDVVRDALGADVTLVLAGGGSRHGRVATDGSYASASDPRLVFALGAEERVTAVRVRWADGSVEEFPAVERGRTSTLRQGDGRVSP